jgi:hypothetical protein
MSEARVENSLSPGTATVIAKRMLLHRGVGDVLHSRC